MAEHAAADLRAVELLRFVGKHLDNHERQGMVSAKEGIVLMQNFMVFDVESVGLHGEGFAVGYVVVNGDGETLEEGLYICDPDEAQGPPADRRWIDNNVPAMNTPWVSRSPKELRTEFWNLWQVWKKRGVTLWADCAWPVEARFLTQCTDDAPKARELGGPYPLHEIATVALLCGCDPLATLDRLPNELPAHNPLNDARQSARVLIAYLRRLGRIL